MHFILPFTICYEKACEYYEKYQILDVPQKYKTEDGISLGYWITTLRRVREGKTNGIMDEERIRKLDAIGMLWGTDQERRWNANYEHARLYYEKNGHLNMLVTYQTEDGIALGNWVAYQRKRMKEGKLSEPEIEKLNAIGMVWCVKESVFDMYYKAAQCYANENGNCNAPQEYITEDGLKLGIWISTQRVRYRKGAMNKTEIEALEKLSIDWGYSQQDRWSEGYNHLKQYIGLYGNKENNNKTVMIDGFQVGKWLNLQKRYYTQGILSKDRISAIEELGITWDRTSQWDVMYEEAKRYYITHGHLRIKRNYMTPDGIRLGVWVGKQRTYKNKLRDNQIDRLNSIGMDWLSIHERKWEEGDEAVEKYYQFYGNVRYMPSDYTSNNGTNVRSWIRLQRNKYKQNLLSEIQIKRLEKVGVI